MMNRVMLVGRLVKQPDLSYTPQGIAVAHFTLAVNRSFKNQNGDIEADFLRVTVWRKAAENVANFLSKGSLAGVDGRVQTSSYEKDGVRMYATEVVADSVQFLESKSVGRQKSPQTQATNQANPYDQQSNQPVTVPDDDLPF